MSCGLCGSGVSKAIRPKERDICSGEVLQSDGVAVQIPVPREREFGFKKPEQTSGPEATVEEGGRGPAGHMPYRSWCAFCVMGRGKATPHKKQSREDGLPELHLDYCSMGTKD